MKLKSKPTITHEVEVPTTIANRMVDAAVGVLILENNGHQYQTGEFVKFHVVEDGYCSITDIGNPLMEQIWVIKEVYSGRGIEPGYIVALVKYLKAKDEEEEDE